MARATINRLSDRKVRTTKAGMHADGAGLYLRVTEGKPGEDGDTILNRYWLFRYKQRGTRKDRQLGIGTGEACRRGRMPPRDGQLMHIRMRSF